MTTHRAPLVGMRFHPPATAILQCLPAGAPLVLVPEPENPYDANAIAVRVATAAVPLDQHPKLALTLGGFGYDLDQFLAEPEWDLGHVKANNNQDPTASSAAIMAPLIPARQWLEERLSCPGRLAFDMDGRPHVEVDLPAPTVAS